MVSAGGVIEVIEVTEVIGKRERRRKTKIRIKERDMAKRAEVVEIVEVEVMEAVEAVAKIRIETEEIGIGIATEEIKKKRMQKTLRMSKIEI